MYASSKGSGESSQVQGSHVLAHILFNMALSVISYMYSIALQNPDALYYYFQEWADNMNKI